MGTDAFVVVSLGNVALKAITGNDSATIGQAHGKPMKTGIGKEKTTIVLFPLYHPASVIYRRQLRKTYIEDIEKLKQFLST